MKKTIFIVFTSFFLFACNSQKENINSEGFKDNSLAMAVLYNYYSSEYKALTHQAYNAASSRLNAIADTASNIASLSVVVDIDETVLDNSPYQAKSIIKDFAYPEGWDHWCNQALAEAVPGSLDFLKNADSLGFKIFYVSNRKKATVYDKTLENLINVGFPQLGDENVLLRLARSDDNPFPSEKESRREYIQNMGFEIVLLAGDALGDFYTDINVGGERDRILNSVKSEFGERYIVLPNAIYGNWQSAIGLDGSLENIALLLQKMSDIY
jgi:5'-nucleotidase (lipoprotein e(P4) family)